MIEVRIEIRTQTKDGWLVDSKKYLHPQDAVFGLAQQLGLPYDLKNGQMIIG